VSHLQTWGLTFTKLIFYLLWLVSCLKGRTKIQGGWEWSDEDYTVLWAKAGEWKNIHNTNLHNLYSSPSSRMNKSRSMRWVGHIQKSQGKTPLGRLRCRWKNHIQMDLTEIKCEGMEWIQLSQNKIDWWTFVNTIMLFWVPNLCKCYTSVRNEKRNYIMYYFNCSNPVTSSILTFVQHYHKRVHVLTKGGTETEGV
jgi:hypothetical protein